ncbi:MAG: SAM-dependent methyltransferase [Chloroflexi bacterium]|nr:SAM-dependent methyltransferase [Chloroflexota bacterium]
MPSAVDQEIRELIKRHGRITFAQFMQTILYSPGGGFYSSRASSISTHFSTSPTSHPVFGALIARQLEEMWRFLGEPSPFHVVEVGSGDGALARSIVEASRQMAPGLAEAIRYVAADYDPWWPPSLADPMGPDDGAEGRARPSGQDKGLGIQRVQAEGLRPFRNVAGCILCNELVDNFPVHRFVIQAGRVKEVFVTLAGDSFAEVLDEPSTPRIQERLASLGVSLPEGFRGEVNLAMEEWTGQLAGTLDRGFALTIDYGDLAQDLYSPQHAQGTLACFKQHETSSDPYQLIGQQDITALVDFSSLMRLGEQRGLATVGYTLQRHFLANLGFSSFLDALQAQGLSYARTEFGRIAMMTLVDPDEMGDFKVLAQSKGIGLGIELQGFKKSET